jgi:alkylmercury lyase
MVKTIGNNQAKSTQNLNAGHAIEETATNLYEKLGSERRRIAGQTLQLLANGCPIPPDEIATRLGTSPDKVTSALREWGAEFDKVGNVIGLGLTLVPTRHVYEIDGRKLYTWCAGDALAFPVMLRQNASIESPDPVTGEKIRISVTPDRVEKVEPKSVVVSWVKDIDVKDIRGSGCNKINFFSSSETASKWIAEHRDQTFYPVNDVYNALKDLHLNKYSWILPDHGACC